MSLSMKYILPFVFLASMAEASIYDCGENKPKQVERSFEKSSELGVTFIIFTDKEYPACKIIDVMAPKQQFSLPLTGITVSLSSKGEPRGEFLLESTEGESAYSTAFEVCDSAAESVAIGIHYKYGCDSKSVVFKAKVKNLKE